MMFWIGAVGFFALVHGIVLVVERCFGGFEVEWLVLGEKGWGVHLRIYHLVSVYFGLSAGCGKNAVPVCLAPRVCVCVCVARACGVDLA
jgi:hypothetical protein